MNTNQAQAAFGPFVLDPVERRLMRGGEVVDVSGRYFDALVLLVQERGKLVSKDRLHDEVWRGIPVTDEAITQCIRSLRRELGDDASSPTFIETVPRHGYRFIAAVEEAGSVAVPMETQAGREHLLQIGLTGVAGGALAGLIGGMIYGLAIASEGTGGGVSTVLALTCITVMIAAIAATGVCFGIAAGRQARDHRAAWTVAGGALGGTLVGGFVKLVGVDALALVFGQAPRGITGGLEGLAMGALVGLGVVIASSSAVSLRRGAAMAAGVGGAGGVLIAAIGGRLFGGSLAVLAQSTPNSRLDLSPLGLLAGQESFDYPAQLVSAGLEGALFAGLITLAMLWAERHDAPERQRNSPGSGAP